MISRFFSLTLFLYTSLFATLAFPPRTVSSFLLSLRGRLIHWCTLISPPSLQHQSFFRLCSVVNFCHFSSHHLSFSLLCYASRLGTVIHRKTSFSRTDLKFASLPLTFLSFFRNQVEFSNFDFSSISKSRSAVASYTSNKSKEHTDQV